MNTNPHAIKLHNLSCRIISLVLIFDCLSQKFEIRRRINFRREMLPIRLIFLAMMGIFMVMMSNDVFGSELGDIHKDISSIMDRLDKIEVRSAHLEKNVDKKLDKLVGIVSKLNTEVGAVKTRVGDVTKQVGDVSKKVGVVTKQISDVRNQVNVVDKKVEKVDSDVIDNTGLLGYKFVGTGYEGSHDQVVGKDGTLLKECLEGCQLVNLFGNGEWNGVVYRV